jgi:glutathione peroxidase
LYQKYNSLGLDIIAFPCPQFDNQEPGTNSEILNCLKYVRPGGGFVPLFPLMEKIDVNGATRHPAYAYLTGVCPQPSPFFSDGATWIPWAPVMTNDITWNFEKFLIGRTGNVVRRYTPGTTMPSLDNDIATLLTQS